MKLGIATGAFLILFPSAMLTAPAIAADEIGAVVRGGLLYDNWITVTKAAKPEETHSAWPESNTDKSGDTTHRCKSCHGWDHMGADGAYGSGSYQTGIGGIRGFDGGSVDDVVAVIKGDAHGFGDAMPEDAIQDLAVFVTSGQVDMDALIDRDSKSAKGDAATGEPLYVTLCANCHGATGLEPEDAPPLGALSNANPWEVLHKVLNGQPGEKMPAMRAFDVQVSVDILAYLQTLPKE